MTDLWGREPALLMVLVQTIIAALIAFGVDLTDEQTAALLALTAAVCGLIVRRTVTAPANLPKKPRKGT